MPRFAVGKRGERRGPLGRTFDTGQVVNDILMAQQTSANAAAAFTAAAEGQVGAPPPPTGGSAPTPPPTPPPAGPTPPPPVPTNTPVAGTFAQPGTRGARGFRTKQFFQNRVAGAGGVPVRGARFSRSLPVPLLNLLLSSSQGGSATPGSLQLNNEDIFSAISSALTGGR